MPGKISAKNSEFHGSKNAILYVFLVFNPLAMASGW